MFFKSSKHGSPELSEWRLRPTRPKAVGDRRRPTTILITFGHTKIIPPIEYHPMLGVGELTGEVLIEKTGLKRMVDWWPLSKFNTLVSPRKTSKHSH